MKLKLLLRLGQKTTHIKTNLSYPVFGAKEVHNVNFKPHAIWSSMETSDDKVLSVVHFSVKVKPCFGCLYLVSSEAAILFVSCDEEPLVVNSFKNKMINLHLLSQ